MAKTTEPQSPKNARLTLRQAREPLLKALRYVASQSGRGFEVILSREGTPLVVVMRNLQAEARLEAFVPPNTFLPHENRLDDEDIAALHQLGFESGERLAGYNILTWNTMQASLETLADRCLAVLRDVHHVEEDAEIRVRVRRPLPILNTLITLALILGGTLVSIFYRVPPFYEVFVAFGGPERALVAGSVTFVAVGLALITVAVLVSGLTRLVQAWGKRED